MVLIAGRQCKSRHLSLEEWTKLVARWHEKRPFLIAAAPEDTDFADELCAHFGKLAHRFTGSFEEMCEKIARSEEVFTMDSGSVHIASFFGVPSFVLFSSGRDHKWRPLGDGSRILRRQGLLCQPCTKFGVVPPCPNRYACLKLDDLKPVSAF
jgi:ADP-heptose:LPS heptosyltransferase